MPEVHLGLKGVYFASTTSSFIDGEVGKLLYRGYAIHDLAEHSTFEETAYLLLYGALPTRAELSAFDQQLKQSRPIPEPVMEVIRLTKQAHPMDVLRTAVSALAAYDPDVSDNSLAANLRKGIRLTAQVPTIICAHDRIRKGLPPVTPSNTLSHAANFLYMLFDKHPDPADAKLMDLDFILHAEHGSNASAFACRVAVSSLADLHGGITAAVATLKGPAHGGAAEEVMKMAEDIGTPERAEAYVRERLAKHGKVMGFGHRVYRAEDPRARHLRERSRELAERCGEPRWYQILDHIHEVMKPYNAKGIWVNVDFYAGSIYYLLGVPEDLFIPIFAAGRVPGWVLQAIEQYDDNILLRPLLEYTGPMDLQYVPIDQRG
ncbi:MAG: citrate (Si)-synthase [Chloroflexi bacterium]|nr:citrate (Si)-synthase [Chloroflexota bacterium]MBI4504446.1 citrate (Si)-synthase [Chloroflexota bacterium]